MGQHVQNSRDGEQGNEGAGVGFIPLHSPAHEPTPIWSTQVWHLLFSSWVAPHKPAAFLLLVGSYQSKVLGRKWFCRKREEKQSPEYSAVCCKAHLREVSFT